MSPEETNRVLDDFEAWLLAAGPEGPPPPPAAPFDVAGVLGQFIALRQEVNLQTRSVRAQQEQAAATLEALGRATRPAPAEASRPLLLAIVEAHDALALAGREVARAREAALAALDLPAPGYWARLFGARPVAPDAVARLRGVLDGLVQGYEMGLARLERALARQGVEPAEAVGRPFDPERMEALEPVDAPGRARGEVAEEVRRGWDYQGRVLRFAQVRVAR